MDGVISPASPIASDRSDHVAILDFKTGKPPTNDQVNSGPPSALLETSMLMAGAIADVQATPAELIYWQFGVSQRRRWLTPKVVPCSRKRSHLCVACSRAMLDRNKLFIRSRAYNF